jgi:hypothetical protein
LGLFGVAELFGHSLRSTSLIQCLGRHFCWQLSNQSPEGASNISNQATRDSESDGVNGYLTGYILPSVDNSHRLIICPPKDFTPEREDPNTINGVPLGQIKHICIIGAGAAGLGALKTIMDTKQYKAGMWKPVAFEARDNVGGIW